MQKVKLVTRDGGFVTEITVPPLNPPYEVVAWGQRIFVWDGAAQHYREGLLFVDTSAFIQKDEDREKDKEKVGKAQRERTKK